MEQSAPDITTGFIQMVEAFKAKPELESRITQLEEQLNRVNAVADSAHSEIERLNSKLDAASADKERLTRERDEAMFRSLELEEKTSAVSDLVAKLEGLVRPEPVAKVEAPAPVSEPAKDIEHAEGATYQDRPDFSEIEPNAEQRSTVESQYPGLHEHHPEYSGHEAEQRDEGNSEAPNWNAPAKSEQNSSEQSMGDTNVDKPRPNEGKPYDQKPYWVSDANWKAEGGQGPYDGGSWEAPWERSYQRA